MGTFPSGEFHDEMPCGFSFDAANRGSVNAVLKPV
jgi:hypothetical protein